MASPTRPLLGRENRDASATLPALQKLLQLAYSEDTDEQIEAVMGISKMIERRRFEASLFGPLCHTLSRLVVSEQRTVVAYAARGIKMLMLDDALRPQATVAGIPSVLAAAMGEWEDDAPCLREILGGLQTLCCDKSTVLAVVNAGALGPVLELLGTNNLEIRILSTAIAANVLSFSDSLLLTNEEVIDAFSDCMEALLDAAKSNEGLIQCYGIAALANACAHPVLAGRARELGALELLRSFEVEPTAAATVFRRGYGRLTSLRRRQRAATAVARMNGLGLQAGDIEEGGGGGGGVGGGEETGGGPGKLQFYSFKWGVNPSVGVSFPPRDRLWAVLGFVLWTAVVLLTLWPIWGF